MADRNINENIRKPRRAKGTPFFVQRNYIAAGVVVFSATAWMLFECLPGAKKLKKNIFDGKFNNSTRVQQHIDSMHFALTKPGLEGTLIKLREREF